MQKLSLATFALLYSSKVKAVQVNHLNRKQVSSLVEATDEKRYIPDVQMIQSDHERAEVTETEYLQTEVDMLLGYKPKSCKSGIERIYGESNSLETFEVAQKSGKLWEDPEFNADDTSLSWGNFGFGEKQGQVQKGVAWKRPSEMGEDWTKSPSLYGDLGKPLPQGVHQGSLADCWFLAASSAVAEVPDRIYDVVHNKDYSKAGAFRFNFWIIDGWQGINVDDRVPVINWGSGFRPWATWPSKNHAWWMPLLEKAFAKLNQNYDRIAWGSGAEGLRTLTGMPTLSLNHNNADLNQLQKVHTHWAKMQYPQVASCCQFGDVDGLTSGHAYSLLDIAELKQGGKVVHKIAKMRNPWSKEGYNGKWSDKDSSWTDDWKKQVNLKVADDGVFWMPYENYQTYFDSTSVAFYQSYKITNQKMTLTYRQNKYKVVNPADQYLFISVDQYSHRHYPRAEKCTPSHEMVLYLDDSNGNGVESLLPYAFMKWYGFGMIGKLEGKLPAGTYDFWIVNQGGTKPDITVNIYASSKSPTFTDTHFNS